MTTGADAPWLTNSGPNKAGLLGHDPQREGGNGERGSRAASCGHLGVLHPTSSIE